MIISLDYDGTFNTAPHLWERFIVAFKSEGHTIICCTMRYPEEGDEVKQALGHLVDDIIFTSRRNKATYLYSQGIAIDIWIDDQPHFIFQDALA